MGGPCHNSPFALVSVSVDWQLSKRVLLLLLRGCHRIRHTLRRQLQNPGLQRPFWVTDEGLESWNDR